MSEDNDEILHHAGLSALLPAPGGYECISDPGPHDHHEDRDRPSENENPIDIIENPDLPAAINGVDHVFWAGASTRNFMR